MTRTGMPGLASAFHQVADSRRSIREFLPDAPSREVLDRCLQLFGGTGYMTETPIARAWADARVTRIAGGAAEVMKEIIGRRLFQGAG